MPILQLKFQEKRFKIIGFKLLPGHISSLPQGANQIAYGIGEGTGCIQFSHQRGTGLPCCMLMLIAHGQPDILPVFHIMQGIGHSIDLGMHRLARSIDPVCQHDNQAFLCHQCLQYGQ